MILRPLLHCSAMLILVTAAWSMPVLQPVGSLESPPATTWTTWGEQTYGLTAIDGRMIRWNRPEGHRDQVVHDWPSPPSGMETWGDEVLIRFPGEDGRLYNRSGGDQTFYSSVPSYWHLPNTEINGSPYRVIIEPTSYLAIMSAPGPSNILSLLSFEGMGNIISWDFDGEYAVVANEERLFIVNMEDPLFSYVQAMINPPVDTWIVNDLDLHGTTLAVNWGDRFQLYEVNGTATPELLDEALTDDSFLSLDDGWLATWDLGASLVTIWDVQDPATISVHGSFEGALDMDHHEEIRFDDDHCMWTSSDLGLMRYSMPVGAVNPLGPSWPAIEARTMAMVNGAVYLQGSHDRLIVNLTGPRVAGVQPDVADFSSNVLLPVDGFLYHNIVSDALTIESLANPLVPEVVAEIGAPVQPLDIDVSGPLLALIEEAGLTLYDVSEPVSPLLRGSLDLPGVSEHVLIAGELAVVLTTQPSLETHAQIIDVSDQDHPSLVTTIVLDPPGGESRTWSGGGLVLRDQDVLVMCIGNSASLPAITQTMTIDLSNPSEPQHSYLDDEEQFWCYGPGDDGRQVQHVLPVQIGDYHISFDMDTVTVYEPLTGPADLDSRSTWTTSGEPVENIAVDGNLLLVVNGSRLDLLTLSHTGLVAVPEAPQAMSVHAAPNPFNPLTDIKFTMTRAGRADVDIIDARGRRVKSLRAELPQGTASLRWDGTDHQGRAAPSGTYLLRVVTPNGAAVGRCQLVR